MKSCKNCQTNPVWIFTNKQQLCKQHFINYFEKKIMYTIRKFSMLNNKDSILLKRSERNFSVLYPILKQLIETRQINLTTSHSSNYNKIISGESADNISAQIIETIITKKSKDIKKLAPIYKKLIRPLYLLLDSEIQLYAKLKKIKLKKQPKSNKLQLFIKSLEEKHPEVKTSIVQSLLKHNKI